MLRFAETMVGQMAADGRIVPFEFEVECCAPEVGAPLRLSGEVRFGDRRAPVDPGISRLEVGPPLRDYIRYTLGWTDAEGRRWRFFGQKTVRVLRLVTTMTTLTGTVFRDGEEVGAARLRFPLRTLPRFLASWRFIPFGKMPEAPRPVVRVEALPAREPVPV